MQFFISLSFSLNSSKHLLLVAFCGLSQVGYNLSLSPIRLIFHYHCEHTTVSIDMPANIANTNMSTENCWTMLFQYKKNTERIKMLKTGLPPALTHRSFCRPARCKAAFSVWILSNSNVSYWKGVIWTQRLAKDLASYILPKY